MPAGPLGACHSTPPFPLALKMRSLAAAPMALSSGVECTGATRLDIHLWPRSKCC